MSDDLDPITEDELSDLSVELTEATANLEVVFEAIDAPPEQGNALGGVLALLRRLSDDADELHHRLAQAGADV